MALQHRDCDSVDPSKYRLRYHCTNCGRDFWAEFNKGQRAPRYDVECPVCKTNTGNKAYQGGPDA